MATKVFSFGFKHPWKREWEGIFFDVRDLPNPFKEQELRPLRGDHPAVEEFFTRPAHTAAVEEAYSEILEAAKKTSGHIYIGCSGGRHRSVYLADRLSKELGIPVEHTSPENL